MNAGFANLDTLKKRLLAATLAGNDQFDDVILAIGLGMAGLIEQYCQRKFAMQTDFQETFSADRIHFLLSRTPLISFTKSELKENETAGWVQQDATFIQSIDQENGIIHLPDGPDAGEYWSQVRFTYTGGYWWEMLEPDDEAYPSQMPANAIALPEEVKIAWLMQCEDIWSKRDKLGLGMVDKPNEQSKLSEIQLLPVAKLILGNFVKLNLT